MGKRTSGVVAVLVVSLLAAPPAATGSSDGRGPEDGRSSAERPEVRTIDDQLAGIAAEVPEFGGLSVDKGSRTVRVYLTRPDSEALARARAALVREFSGDGAFTAVRGDFGFGELYGWYGRLAPEALTIYGVAFTDIDEAANRLRIGVADDRVAAAVRERMARLGVPEAAVVFERTAPYVQLDLDTGQQQMRGGLQITNDEGGGCTLGFVAKRAGHLGFVTNSHCTREQGGVEDTLFRQAFKPSPAAPAQATEVADPPYFGSFDEGTPHFCPHELKCRFSDSAFAEMWSADVFSSPGTIARPAALAAGAAWDDVSTYRIVAEWQVEAFVWAVDWSELWSQLQKVGQTTGWTQGQLLETCIDVRQYESVYSGGAWWLFPTDFTMLCQYRAGFESEPGDSGSPVFHFADGEPHDVYLLGVLWGGNDSSSVFSDMKWIRVELGDLDNCVPGKGC